MDRRNDTVTASRRQIVTTLGLLGDSLEIDLDTRFSRLLLGFFILLLSLQNFFLTLAVSHVFNTHMNALFNDPSVHQLVDADSHRTLGHVENNSGASVVSLVWHTLVYGRIGEDIHVIAHLDFHQVLAEMDRSLLAKVLGKHVARTRPDSE